MKRNQGETENFFECISNFVSFSWETNWHEKLFHRRRLGLKFHKLFFRQHIQKRMGGSGEKEEEEELDYFNWTKRISHQIVEEKWKFATYF